MGSEMVKGGVRIGNAFLLFFAVLRTAAQVRKAGSVLLGGYFGDFNSLSEQVAVRVSGKDPQADSKG